MTRILRSLVIAVIAISAAGVSFAAERSQQNIEPNKWKTAEKNYVYALEHGNEGVKISAARFLADYRLTGSVEALEAALKSDKSENVRMSAALALVMLDEHGAREAVNDASLYDGSDRVAKFCEALLQVHTPHSTTIAEE